MAACRGHAHRPRSAHRAVRPHGRGSRSRYGQRASRRAAASCTAGSITRADRRLLDAYQAGAVSLAELSERRHRLAEECHALERQQEERPRLRHHELKRAAVRTTLVAFCTRLRSRLAEASFADKQAILQLVI